MRARQLLIFGALLLTISSVSAQDPAYPDLRGRWKGTNEGVVLGSGTYHRDGKSSEPLVMRKEFTFIVKGQDGRSFWGEIVGEQDKGPFLGVIASDKQSLHLVDSAGGHIGGKLIDHGRFEMCYLRSTDNVMVAACNIHTKQ